MLIFAKSRNAMHYSTSLASASIISILKDFKKSSPQISTQESSTTESSNPLQAKTDFQSLADMELMYSSIQNMNKLGRKYFATSTIATKKQIDSMVSMLPTLSKLTKSELAKLLNQKKVYNNSSLKLLNIPVDGKYLERLNSWKTTLELDKITNENLVQVFVGVGFLQSKRKENLSDLLQYSNRNLAFEGDALLEFVMKRYTQLYCKYGTEKNESIPQLFEARNSLNFALLSNINLNRVARKLRLSQFLFDSSFSHSSVKLEADAVEALVGVVRENMGFEYAIGFIVKYILPAAVEMLTLHIADDYETKIKHEIYSMARELSLPQPTATKENYFSEHNMWCSTLNIGQEQIKAYGFVSEVARKEALHKAYYWLLYKLEAAN